MSVARDCQMRLWCFEWLFMSDLKIVYMYSLKICGKILKLWSMESCFYVIYVKQLRQYGLLSKETDPFVILWFSKNTEAVS